MPMSGRKRRNLTASPPTTVTSAISSTKRPVFVHADVMISVMSRAQWIYAFAERCAVQEIPRARDAELSFREFASAREGPLFVLHKLGGPIGSSHSSHRLGIDRLS